MALQGVGQGTLHVIVTAGNTYIIGAGFQWTSHTRGQDAPGLIFLISRIISAGPVRSSGQTPTAVPDIPMLIMIAGSICGVQSIRQFIVPDYHAGATTADICQAQIPAHGICRDGHLEVFENLCQLPSNLPLTRIEIKSRRCQETGCQGKGSQRLIRCINADIPDIRRMTGPLQNTDAAADIHMGTFVAMGMAILSVFPASRYRITAQGDLSTRYLAVEKEFPAQATQL